MTPLFARLIRWLDQVVSRPIGRFVFTFSNLPLVIGAITAYLFAANRQLQEIYVSYAENLEPARLIFAAVAILLLCSAIHLSYVHLATIGIDRLYARRADIESDRGLKIARNIFAAVAASLPILGIIIGIAEVSGGWLSAATGSSTASSLGVMRGNLEAAGALHEPGPSQSTELLRVLQDRLANLSILEDRLLISAIILAALAACFVAAALVCSKKWWWKRCTRPMRRIVFVALASVILGGVLLPYAFAGSIVDVGRSLGPLATITLAITVLFCFTATLSFASHWSRFPVLSCAILAVLGLVWWKATVSPTAAGSPDARQGDGPRLGCKTGRCEIGSNFESWLEARKAEIDLYSEKSQAYPVFIIAAQGGGIYAASATATFLARVQDRCPNFAQHVFAISSVSGGSIGASVFDQLLAPDKPIGTLCGEGKQGASASRIESRTIDVLAKDHVSPVVTALLGDVAGSVWPISHDRAWALEDSLSRSVAGKPAEDACPGDQRSVHFQRWDPERSKPALVLNATWAETGHRVASAPFALREVGEGTLHAYSDFQGLSAGCVLQAAVTSARFPGILPPLQERARRWSFVDGGYADNSGATTALDLHRALSEWVDNDEKRKGKIDLRMIVLTAHETVNPDKIRGSAFADFVAPISALINVRSIFSGAAITRAHEHLRAEGANAQQKDGERGKEPWKINLVKLDLDSFPLPLGWTMSNLSHSLVSLEMGRAEFCDLLGGEKDSKEKPGFVDILRENSCAMRRVIEVLQGRAGRQLGSSS
jgi:hypothetical protein